MDRQGATDAVNGTLSRVRHGWWAMQCRLGDHAWGLTLLNEDSRQVGWECRHCGVIHVVSGAGAGQPARMSARS